jgi:hypothetical protein
MAADIQKHARKCIWENISLSKWHFKKIGILKMFYVTYNKECNPEFPGIVHVTSLTVAQKVAQGDLIPCFLKTMQVHSITLYHPSSSPLSY